VSSRWSSSSSDWRLGVCGSCCSSVRCGVRRCCRNRWGQCPSCSMHCPGCVTSSKRVCALCALCAFVFVCAGLHMLPTRDCGLSHDQYCVVNDGEGSSGRVYAFIQSRERRNRFSLHLIRPHSFLILLFPLNLRACAYT